MFPVQLFQPQPFAVGSIFQVLHEYADYVIRPDEFPTSDPTRGGNPDGWCVVLLSKLVLLQKHHGWSEREAVRRARVDMEVKACLELGLEQAGPSQPTLSRHTRRMQELGLDDVYLRRMTDLLLALELVSRDEAVLVDSVPIRGAGQELDSYNLLAGSIRKGLRALARAQGRSADELAAEHGLRAYLDRSIKGSFAIDWSDESARTAVLAQLVADARRVRQLLEDVRSASEGRDDDDDPPRQSAAVEDAQDTIEDLIEHDVELDDDGTVLGLRQVPAGDRRISLTDPDMRHGRKSASRLIAGFKAQIVATLAYGFILVARVIAANRHDGEDLPGLMQDVQDLGLTPAWCSGDQAYGTIANHRHFRDNACGELIARMPRPDNGGRFTKDEFDYDFRNHVLTCPAGQKATLPRWAMVHGRKGRRFEFATEQCGGCPYRQQCVSPKADPQRRSVFIIDDDEHLIREHLQTRETHEFRDRLSKRIRVEHAIAGFAQCGGKQARRFGIDNVAFDANLSALTYNLRRLHSLLRANPALKERMDELVAAFCRLVSSLLGLILPRRRIGPTYQLA